MNIDLTGKTALVTGSTSGIGLAIARGLARAGARVVVNGRSEAGVARALERLRAEVPGATLLGCAADVGSAEGCEALAQAGADTDILVNNAGTFALQDFFEIPDEQWRRFFEVNVLAGARLARLLAPAMVRRGWGRIVFISSESALNIPPDMIHYGTTKTALLGLSRGLAKRLAGSGVTVNAVLPGPTLTEGMARMLQDEIARSGRTPEQAAAAFVRAHRPSSILQRASSVDEVAHMVVYAASPQASATTGAALRVDGGVVDSIT